MIVPPRPLDEDARQLALDAYDILDSADEESFDEIVQMASELCGTPIALITLIDRDRQWVKAAVGTDLEEMPRALTFCGHAILEDKLMMVPDAAVDPRFADNPLVVDGPSVRFYAGMPIETPDGFLLGTLCVVDHTPRELTATQQRHLAILSRQVIAQLELRRSLRDERRERESAERERDRFFDLSVDPMCVTDLDGNFVRVNKAFARLLGLTIEQVLAEPYSRLVHPDDVDATAAHGRAVLRATGPIAHENRYRSAEGGWRTIAWTSTWAARERRYYSIARDVTDQRLLEKQLRHSQKMEAIGQLAGGIAHDFNNVLSVITGLTSFVLEELPDDHTTRPDIAEIQHAAQRAAAMTRQLLVFSRGNVADSPRIVVIDKLIVEVEKMMRRLFSNKISLVTVPTPDLWSLRADPAQIEQVLVNLIVNARDAMPNGGKIRVETANVTVDPELARSYGEMAAGDYVRLSVIDNGIGMTPETQARIFEPFFTTKEIGKGTGLGLATVFGIVKTAGGHIYVESEVGAGTTFRIYFPRATPVRLSVPPPFDRPHAIA